MTVTLTYDAALSRVRVSADGLGDAVSAVVERSVNEVTWTTVRGGTNVLAVGGEITVDDYEFVAGAENFYRVRYADTATFVAAGTAAHADNAVVAPALPAGATTGDLLLLWCATRASAQGTPTPAPGGYTELLNAGNARLYGKIHDGSESAPTLFITGFGAAGMSVSAQMAAFRGAALEVSASDGQLNAAAQNVAYPALGVDQGNCVVLTLGWKQDDWTSVVSPGTEIGEPSTTLGDDQGLVWSYTIQTAALDVSSGSFAVTGGTSVVSRGAVVALMPGELSQSDSITPVLDGVWLKFLARPFLNTQVRPIGHPNTTRRSRGAEFDVVGRSLAVGLHDKRGGRQFELSVLTESQQDYERLDLILASGDPVFLHTPPNSPWPTLYAAIGDVSDEQPIPHTHFTTLPMREVAAPSAEIVGATATFQTILNTHATFADVLSSYTSFQDLLELIAQPGDIVVP